MRGITIEKTAVSAVERLNTANDAAITRHTYIKRLLSIVFTVEAWMGFNEFDITTSSQIPVCHSVENGRSLPSVWE